MTGRVGPGPFTALLWLLFALLVIAIGIVVLRACELRLPFLALGGCPAVIAADPRLDEELRRQGQLEREIRQLEIALLDRPICEPPPPVTPIPEPEPEPERAELPAEPPPVTPTPEPEPEPEPQPEPGQEAEAEPLEPCPPDRRRATEVILVLDTSGSMDWDFALDPRIEAELIELSQGNANILNMLMGDPNLPPAARIFGGLLGGALGVDMDPARMRRLQELQGELDKPHLVDRIDVAKQSLRDLVNASASDVEFTFVTFDQCRTPLNGRRYDAASRPALLNAIDNAQLGPNTALAETIASLPQAIGGGRSEDQPVNVVLVSDGGDSCGGDPCAAAAGLKRSLPFAYINAIAINQDASQAQCIAGATGGTFVAADNSEELALLLVRAAGQDLPEHCR